MTIEEEIKQKKFKSEYEKLEVNILFTAGWVELRNLKVYKQFGISVQQYNILRILRGQYPKPANIILLIDRMLDKMSNVSRLVDKLVNKSLVTRTSCPNDRRKVDVVITKKGLDLLENVESMPEYKKIFPKTLSVEEAKTLNELLNKLRNIKEQK